MLYLTNNSLELYRELQSYRTRFPYPGDDGFEESVKWYYIDLIKTMFFELIVSDQSPLLSYLCENQIEYHPKYFILSTHGIERHSNFDLYPIVQSLSAIFQENFQVCFTVFEKNAQYLFANYQLPLEAGRQILECLMDIDTAMGRLKGKANLQQVAELTQCCNQQKEQIVLQRQQLEKQKSQLAEKEQQLTAQRQQLMTQEQQLAEQKRELAVREQQPTVEREQQPAVQENQITEQERQQIAQSQHSEERELSLEQELGSVIVQEISRIEESNQMEHLSLPEKLRLFASNRQREDEDLLQRIQHLQVDLQAELQEIAKIREGLEYETLRESIMQVLAIHDLLWNILENHPMPDSAAGYDNLIYSCQDLKENVVEALTMLGVTYINDTGVPYLPHMHRTPRGIQPVRNAMITKVLRPGFSYRSQTLEKAIVEL